MAVRERKPKGWEFEMRLSGCQLWDRDDDDDDNIRLWMGEVISYSVVGARDDGGKRDGRYCMWNGNEKAAMIG